MKNRCISPLSAMSHLRFCRAILSRDFDARQSRSVQLHSRTLRLWRSVIRIAGSHVCLSQAASKSQRATTKSHAATLPRVRIARQSRAIKSQVWHGTKPFINVFACLLNIYYTNDSVCPHIVDICELSSPRFVQSASWQSASWRIRELSSNRRHVRLGGRQITDL